MLRARRALISVSDKSGVAAFASGLVELGVEVISTGGTLQHLQDHGVEARKVATVTESPEILGGRVKTLHPRIHGGILANRADEAHMAELAEQGITPIDIVAVNLYPFAKTVAQEGVTSSEAVEMIDIGGPCMTRAAAKNHEGVVVVVDPADYDTVLAALREGDGTEVARFLHQTAISAEDCAESLVKGLAEERFLILPHPEVEEYFRRKSSDYDRWLGGMQRLKRKMHGEQ